MTYIPTRKLSFEAPPIQFSDWLITAILLFTLTQSGLDRLGLMNKYLSLMPELLGVFMLGMLMLGAGRLGGPRLAPVYWPVFAFMCLHILLGAIFNEGNIGSGVTSLRYYLRWVPVFLFPVFFGVSDHALRLQFKLIAILALVQLPVALGQRVIWWSAASGDMVRGTVPNSASLSIFLASVICIWVAAYTKGTQTLSRTAWVCILLMIPMTLNESKGAIILLPAAVFIVSLSSGSFQERLRRLLWAFGVTSLFFAMYVPIYDSFMEGRKSESIVQFVIDGHAVKYLAGRELGNEKRFGRLDGVIAPLRSHAEAGPTTLAFGLGVGSVSESYLGSEFEGEHYQDKGDLVYAQVSKLLWELGVVGVVGLFVILGLIFRDALVLKESTGVEGVLGLGWVGVIGLMYLSVFYSELMSKEAISYPFWYFSGVVASRAFQIRSVRQASARGVKSTLSRHLSV